MCVTCKAQREGQKLVVVNEKSSGTIASLSDLLDHNRLYNPLYNRLDDTF